MTAVLIAYAVIGLTLGTGLAFKAREPWGPTIVVSVACAVLWPVLAVMLLANLLWIGRCWMLRRKD